ncbi:tetratricopeptide repeat protein [Stieleria sp. JC731]|uniref:tetratricopeptide repeat protein n=1 Tax=Pirellulaceae TaxID=2691357 RepID=UPI001E3AF077|nr:tetratricopeptide repeat protein [Stieleria sp. JC731]MCC9603446.1 tetratricopeptide repeat protein [Stieleria sp. JC731]
MTEHSYGMGDAFAALREGQPDLATEICQQVLDSDPENASAWFLQGILHAQAGRTDDALPNFERAVQFKPESPTYQYNLGLVRSSLRKHDEAIQAYRDAIKLQPEMLEAQNNLGNCLVMLEKSQEAADHFREVARDFPQEAIVHFNLANVLEDIGEYKECIEAYEKAIELDPNFDSARDNLGRTYAGITEYDEALRVWKEWLEHDPENPIPRHMIAGITGEMVPDRCDDDYVLNTFDDTFASSYEKQLSRIGYSVPVLVQDAIDSVQLEKSNRLNVLDAGCGTGLCSSVLRPYAQTLVGVDLSPDMLRLAEQTGRYDDLIEGELTQVLCELTLEFDLIVFGDTLCYFGDLTQVLAAVRQRISSSGMTIFTVENLALQHEEEQADLSVDYRLLPNGRYQHNEEYIEASIQAAGLTLLSITKAKLRMERGREVEGLVVVAKS